MKKGDTKEKIKQIQTRGEGGHANRGIWNKA